MSKIEKDVEALLINACRLKGIRTKKGDPTNAVGFPDRLVFNHIIKEVHFLEFKNETNYGMTKQQVIWKNTIEASGGTYFVINGEEECRNYIRKYIILE